MSLGSKRAFVYDWIVSLWYVWAIVLVLAIAGLASLYEALT